MVISGEKPDNSTTDFNKILLSFLDIDETKSFLVKKALGYYLDEFSKEMETAEEEEQNSAPSTVKINIDEKEKKEELAVIYLSLATVYEPLNKYPKEITKRLVNIVKHVRMLNEVQPKDKSDIAQLAQRNETEKMQWINLGTLKIMLQLICSGDESTFQKKYDLPIEICQNLLLNCQQGCRIFFTTFFNLLGEYYPKYPSKVISLCNSLTKLINVNPLPSVFLRESGVP